MNAPDTYTRPRLPQSTRSQSVVIGAGYQLWLANLFKKSEFSKNITMIDRKGVIYILVEITLMNGKITCSQKQIIELLMMQ